MEQEVLLKIGVDSTDVPKAVNATKALERQIELLARALDEQRITQSQSSDSLSKIISQYHKMGVNALDAQNRINALNAALKKGIDAEREAAMVRQKVSEARARAETSFALAVQKVKEIEAANRALSQQAKAFGEAVVSANTYVTANKSAADSASVFVTELRKQEAQIEKTARANQEHLRSLRESNLANKSAADSASVFVTELRKQEAQIEKTARANQEHLRSLRESNLANKSAADSASVFVRQMQMEQAERLKLEAMYDRNAVAARVYESAVNNLNRAEQLGVISADRKADELLKLENAYRLAGSSSSSASTFINQFGEGASVAGIKTSKFGMYAQQVGYQVGDFFVQIQSGTNAFVAFGQQATQLAGLLPGLAGAIVGIGISVATTFLSAWSRASAAIDNAAKSIELFQGKLSSAKDEIIDMAFEIDRLKRGFDDANEYVLTVDVENAKKRIAELEQQIYDLELAGAPSGPNQRNLDIERARLEVARETLAEYIKLREAQRQLTEERDGELKHYSKAEQYHAGMIALQTAYANKIKADEQARASAIAQQYKFYADTRKEAEALSESLGEAYLGAVGLGQVDVSKGVNAAAQAALLLAQRLNISLGAAQGMILLSAEKRLESQNLAAQYSQYGQGRSAAEALIRESEPIYGGTGNVLDGMNYYDAQSVNGASSVVESGVDFTSRVLGADFLEAINRAKEETALYQKEVQMLDSALSSGLITQSEYNSYVRQAQEAYGQAAQGAYDYEKAMNQVSNTAMSSMEDAFMSILDGSKSASDAFRDMARAIISEAMKMLVIRPLLQGIFGGGGGFLGGLLNANGNAFIGGDVTPFANGGVVGGPTTFPMSGGRTGLMGEAGPEAIMPLKRTSSGKLGVIAEGGGAVTVNNNINVQGDNAAAVRQEIAKLMPTITEATKSAVIDARRRGGQMRAAFS